ncbi:MAG: glycoside hydrolase family 127 protein [Verrucomicrobia bacterium]|nr:glycoside hydrolase family 127 protein [Verrucomicrobiota bacterium]
MKSLTFFSAMSCLLATATFASGDVTVVDRPDTSAMNAFYPANRAPLAPSPFVKLPVGSITPKGWLRHQLGLEKDGMVGRLKEISPWLNFEKSSWGNKEGKGGFGWEELPYWLKGYGDLGYVLRDDAIIAEAKKWIESAMGSQREDGWFGPRELLTSLKGKPDLWPHMVMLNILQSYHEFSGDRRVLDVMTRYLKWENTLPASAFGEGYWPKIRAGDNIESAFWLYNRTGEAWLLDLAKKIHQGMARWDTDVIDWHNVNLAQGFRAGTVFWMQSKDAAHLESAERNYTKLMGLYGQFPGGGFVGDENCRQGYDDPRGGIETCGIVEFTHSFQMLMKITGNPLWIDRCEEIAFNNFPASMTPDQKGLHYVTCANQVQLDRLNKSPGIQNGGTMFSYSPFQTYRCCQHNVSHGWPYYAEELWLATPDNGLCASLYAASEVSAKVGDGTTVKITEETDYPFSETIQFKLALPKAAKFPLYLRIPRWCDAASVKINGQAADMKAKPLALLALNREWKDGDTVSLQLPMKLAVRTWEKNKNAVSVDHGPLSYSLAIKERWAKYGNRNANWPEWEVFPDSPWNYGLVLDSRAPEKSFTVVRKQGPLPAQPFTPDAAPISLKAKARKIPNWQADQRNMVDKLQPSPVKSDEPVEEVTLIPMGAARLRIAMFPVIGTGPDAREWVAPSKPKPSAYKASASLCNDTDTVEALGDGLEPRNSNDHDIPRMTWWSHKGTAEWAQYDFGQPMKVSSVAVYWYDDTGTGQCRVPASWKVLFRDGDQWKEVSNAHASPISRNKYNIATFDPVQTTALRLEVQLQPSFSGGILEWQCGAEEAKK